MIDALRWLTSSLALFGWAFVFLQLVLRLGEALEPGVRVKVYPVLMSRAMRGSGGRR